MARAKKRGEAKKIASIRIDMKVLLSLVKVLLISSFLPVAEKLWQKL